MHKVEKYVFECYFEDTPKCEWCMLSKNTGEHRNCMALGIRPRCPEEGCRKDCPLKKIEWTTTEQSTEQSAGQSTEQPTERPIDRFDTISSPLTSSPIPATPILKGQDLVSLVDDLKGPDKGGARRERARKLLEKVNKQEV